jgi:hypothetical protein
MNEYIDLKHNGVLFPSWILQNFKQYKLPPVIRSPDEDPCNIVHKQELHKYQTFLGNYIGPNSPYNECLLYHGMGSGKTVTVINLINLMYAADPNTNIVILIKASLHTDPWMNNLRRWLHREKQEENMDVTNTKIYQNVHLLHYDSPFADKDFMDLMKKLDLTKRTMFVIEESHNFIRNVYSNINTSGHRARIIYDYILKFKIENHMTKVLLLSATPIVNVPYELSLIFNLLRPGILPSSEAEFNRMFVTDSLYPVLRPDKKNLFERRIMGLVSYYVGATPDLYAELNLKHLNLPMSDYQYDIYRIFEKMENDIEQRMKKRGKVAKLYRTYTRQACNFVFPHVNEKIRGDLRPRPKDFNITDLQADSVEKAKQANEQAEEYIKAMNKFVSATKRHFEKIMDNSKRKLKDDLDDFKENYDKYEKDFKIYYENAKNISDITKALYECSPKMIANTFYTYVCPGKVMIFSNYVYMEGLDMQKVYLELAGISVCEYHGRIERELRNKTKELYNADDNIRGEIIKVILLSPSATEGIQLYNMRLELILEPYWNDVRTEQVIGRGHRQCSHKQLKQSERKLDVIRLKVIKPNTRDSDDTENMTADEIVEDIAKAKSNLNETFINALKEAAVDCVLFKSHNQMSKSYNCFNFQESLLLTKNIGAAYKDDIKDDIKYDIGLYAPNTKIERIRVTKIRGVFIDSYDSNNKPLYTEPQFYWLNSKTSIVYDYDTHYPVGKLHMENDEVIKIDAHTYVISNKINIPNLKFN